MVSASVTSLPDATTLAVERTRLAHERTLMAWGRTATSLISFGFTIYKFFQYLRETGETPVRETLIGPRGFALIMIAIGLTALTLATIEHRRSMRALRNHYGELVPMSLATLTAGLIATLGVLMLLAVALRQEGGRRVRPDGAWRTVHVNSKRVTLACGPWPRATRP